MIRHHVTIRPSGRSFTAEPSQTILQAADQAGITLPHGCRNGACGACKARVTRGTVRYESEPAPAALGAEERAQGYALLCHAQADSDLEIDVRVADALDGVVARKMPARIERIDWVGKDVAVLTVKLPPSEELLYRAGQYVDFILPSGVRRSYSIASLPGKDSPVEFHIRHMPGGTFTDALFGFAGPAVKERGILRIEGPLGSFYLREDASEPILLLASGTGFAPIKAIAETIFAKGLNRDDPSARRRGRQVLLYWGARTQADLYMDALPRQWEREQPNFQYIPVLSEPEPGAGGEPAWQGRTGLVHLAVMADIPDLSTYQVYACGLPIMVQSAHRDFVGLHGLKEENFFSDAFVSRADLAAPKP